MIKEFPKNVKFSRCFRLKLNDNSKIINRYLLVNNYFYGIKAIEVGWITNKQITSLRRTLRIILPKYVKVKINSSLMIPVSHKPLESRMGSGKGSKKSWKAPITKGMIIMEMSYFNNIKNIIKVIKSRLPFLVKLIKIHF